MAAYEYQDWDQQAGEAAQLARLLLHLAEVRQKLGSDVGGGGYSKSGSTPLGYYQTLVEERKRLEKKTGLVNAGTSVARRG